MTPISGRAPGKLVLSGDYIALLGAPALVLAVNRMAIATLTTKRAEGWSVRSNVTPLAKFGTLDTLLKSGEQPLIKTVIDALPDRSNLPQHAEISLDTTTFYQNNHKLGIGSSAAILVALAEVLGHLSQHRFSTATLIDLHNSLHGSNGSGLDIVAARLGGLTRFQYRTGMRVTPASGLHMRFVFTGASTDTEPMLARFRTLVDNRSYAEIETWKQLANAVVEAIGDREKFLDHMAKLNQFVLKFDRETGLGIYGEQHLIAHELAEEAGVLYKPCGAGGSDTGVALSSDPRTLDTFEQHVTREGLTTLNLRMENHGANIQL